nr:hypothetical protein [Nitrosomonas nitrosa]
MEKSAIAPGLIFSRFDFGHKLLAQAGENQTSVSRNPDANTASAIWASAVLQPLMIIAFVFFLTAIFVGLFKASIQQFTGIYFTLVLAFQTVATLGLWTLVFRSGASFKALVGAIFITVSFALWWPFATSAILLWVSVFGGTLPTFFVCAFWLQIVQSTSLVGAIAADSILMGAIVNSAFTLLFVFLRNKSKDQILRSLKKGRDKALGDNPVSSFFWVIVSIIINTLSPIT